MANPIVWCGIPVVNLDRAIKFYSAVLGAEVKRQELSGMAIATLPHNDGEVGGCLFASDSEKPTNQGIMVYLNANMAKGMAKGVTHSKAVIAGRARQNDYAASKMEGAAECRFLVLYMCTQ